MGEFPSGQRGQTVNLLRFASMVRIRPPPPQITAETLRFGGFLLYFENFSALCILAGLRQNPIANNLLTATIPKVN